MSTADSINYTPTTTGRKFMLSDANTRLIVGPVGSAKSTLCCMEIFRRCAEMPRCKDGFRRSRWVVVRNTRDQLKKTTLNTWKQWFKDGVHGKWKESEMTFFLELADIRAEVMFLPLDTPDDQRRLLSLECTGVFINEAREVHPDLINAARSRMPRYPSKAMLPDDPVTGKPVKYWSGLIMDTNPPNEDSWLYKQFEEVKPDGWEVFKQPSGLSPEAENRENLGDTYYEDMMQGQTEDWIRVHVHGLYGRSMLGKAVFEASWNHDFHVAQGPLVPFNSINHPIVIGLDFGRTPAARLMQRNAMGQVCMLDELDSENMGLEQFITSKLKPLLSARFPGMPYLVAGDPAGWAKSQINEQSCADVLKAQGFRAKRPASNAIDVRLRAVETLLLRSIGGRPAFLVDPRCKMTIRAFNGGYRYKLRKDGFAEETPEKNQYSHGMDALQYACLLVETAVAGEYMRSYEVEKVKAAGWA